MNNNLDTPSMLKLTYLNYTGFKSGWLVDSSLLSNSFRLVGVKCLL